MATGQGGRMMMKSVFTMFALLLAGSASAQSEGVRLAQALDADQVATTPIVCPSGPAPAQFATPPECDRYCSNCTSAATNFGNGVSAATGVIGGLGLSLAQNLTPGNLLALGCSQSAVSTIVSIGLNSGCLINGTCDKETWASMLASGLCSAISCVPQSNPVSVAATAVCGLAGVVKQLIDCTYQRQYCQMALDAQNPINASNCPYGITVNACAPGGGTADPNTIANTCDAQVNSDSRLTNDSDRNNCKANCYALTQANTSKCAPPAAPLSNQTTNPTPVGHTPDVKSDAAAVAPPHEGPFNCSGHVINVTGAPGGDEDTASSNLATDMQNQACGTGFIKTDVNQTECKDNISGTTTCFGQVCCEVEQPSGPSNQ